MNQIVKDLDLNVAKEQVNIAKAKSATPVSKLQSGLVLTFSKAQEVVTTNDDGTKKSITRLVFTTESDEEMRLTPNLISKFTGVQDVFSGAFKIDHVEMQSDGVWIQEVRVSALATATSQA